MPFFTFIFLLPEELLAVVGRVRLLHLSDPVSRHLAPQRRREEGGAVLLRGRRRAERCHLRKDSRLESTQEVRFNHMSPRPRYTEVRRGGRRDVSLAEILSCILFVCNPTLNSRCTVSVRLVTRAGTRNSLKPKLFVLLGSFTLIKWVTYRDRNHRSKHLKAPKEQMFGFLFVFKNRGTNKPKRRGSKKVS